MYILIIIMCAHQTVFIYYIHIGLVEITHLTRSYTTYYESFTIHRHK